MKTAVVARCLFPWKKGELHFFQRLKALPFPENKIKALLYFVRPLALC